MSGHGHLEDFPAGVAKLSAAAGVHVQESKGLRIDHLHNGVDLIHEGAEETPGIRVALSGDRVRCLWIG